MRRIAINDFFNFDEYLTHNSNGVVFTQIKSCIFLDIPKKYGTGRIMISPLIGGANLIIFEACFNEDTEIYSEQVLEKNPTINICLQGSVINRCQTGSDIVIKQHEGIFVRYDKTHRQVASCYQSGEKNCFVTIQLTSDWIKLASKDFPLDVFTNLAWQGVYHLGEVSAFVQNVAYEIVQITYQTDMRHTLLTQKVLELWSHQLDLLKKLSLLREHNPNLKTKDIVAIHKVANILLDEMLNPPSLLSLAKCVGINDNKLKKYFKQIYGITVFSFLQQQRLEKAKNLIREKKYNATIAATAVGFKSVSHFSTIFKKTVGMTPKQFRNL